MTYPEPDTTAACNHAIDPCAEDVTCGRSREPEARLEAIEGNRRPEYREERSSSQLYRFLAMPQPLPR
jgi:hypothetical protein